MMMLQSASKVTINTGNVLDLIDIKKKAGQNVSEELSESIKLTLSEWGSQNGTVNNLSNHESNAQSSQQPSNYMIIATPNSTTQGAVLNITRPHDDVKNKMAEEERKNLKIGVKIFINEANPEALRECLENVFAALHIEYVDNVILAYDPEVKEQPTEESNFKSLHTAKASPISLGSNIVNVSTNTELDGESDADLRKCDRLLPGIKVLWAVLEDYVKDGRVGLVGVADAGCACLRRLHEAARVRPAIAQISLASCCAVPPALQLYCRAHDVQLLTHADPADLLSVAAVKALSDAGVKCRNLDWCARYQVHIKCRGVLALKGYVCKATVNSNAHKNNVQMQ